mmetsp:Transcript_28890/g.52322  ORF Transcript_28890/g.52322 Transcript_28890/m.52322 type:complete len:99 (-) Transcript_28890:74-370(-)
MCILINSACVRPPVLPQTSSTSATDDSTPVIGRVVQDDNTARCSCRSVLHPPPPPHPHSFSIASVLFEGRPDNRIHHHHIQHSTNRMGIRRSYSSGYP